VWAGASREAFLYPLFLQYKAVGDQFPEVFYRKIFHAVFFFDAVELPVAAVAGDNHHFGACRFYLINFPFTVKDSFLVVPGCECAAPASAAQLVLLCRINIDPVFQALIQYPSRFVKKSVTEYLFGFPAIIARIMIRGNNLKS